MNKIEYVAALRELADFVEGHDFPELLKGWWWEDKQLFQAPSLTFSVYDKRDFGQICGAMGSFEKESSPYETRAKKQLPSGATIRVSAARDVVCKKVVVGTKTVPATEERIIAAEPEHEEEIVEWKCPESFVALGQEEPAAEPV